MMGDQTPVMELQGVSKSFGSVRALIDVSFRLGAAEVIGLIGDNGAGKSTLIKILSGVHAHDSGKMLFEGQEVFFRSPEDARNRGVETVYQDLALVDDLTIVRNFFLRKELVSRFGYLRMGRMKEISRKALRIFDIEIGDPDTLVANLSGGQRQAVALARAIHFGAKVLILDEPTAALSVKETEKVLACVATAKRQGLSVVMISHNMYHIYPVADRIVVLDKGRQIANLEKAQVTPDELADIIAGRKSV